MKIARILLSLCCFALSLSPTGAAQENERFVYADFETVQDTRPVSKRGGLVQLFTYQESASSPSRFKGAAPDSRAPELVRLSKDDPNRAIAFDFQLQAPNQFAGVGVEVHGQPDKDGKPVADDVSNYKFLTLQLYVKGASSITTEFISRGHGVDMQSGYPAMIFKVSEGFNAYRVPLDSVNQPPWAQTKVKTKDILKKLTSVNFIVTCGPCVPTAGTVVIDNVVFQN
ncbi:MAG: hypothetical protein L0229_19795 [Blastocatellia bacterium]|nr:hypothetical protein [Blastocatellia bacterium]